MTTDFKCAGRGLQIPRDRYDSEYAWWSACVTHYEEAHPWAIARAEVPK
jgi:hypothetical protein